MGSEMCIRDSPRIGGSIGGRIMIADHYKDYRKGQIVVVKRSLFCTDTKFRAGCLLGD